MPEPLSQQIDRLQEIFFSEKDPTGRAFVPLADAHRRMGELDQALDVLQEGLVAHPGSASGHVVAGWLFRDRGNDDAAIGAFERVLELDADNGVALRSLAELVEDAGRALGYLQRLVELDPDDPEAIAALESLKAAMDGPVAADAVLVEDLAPDDAAPLDTEVSARAELTTEESAAEAVIEEPAAEVEPPAEAVTGDEGEIYTQTLAELYAKQGAVDKAVEVYRKLLVDDPDNGMFLHRVAELTRGVDTGPRDERPVVSIESLAPDTEPVAAEAPVEESRVATDDRPLVPIESLAPDAVEAVEPEATIPVGDLAPDPEPVAAEASTDEAAATDGRPVVPIESLAPDGPSDDQGDDPFPWMNRL